MKLLAPSAFALCWALPHLTHAQLIAPAVRDAAAPTEPAAPVAPGVSETPETAETAPTAGGSGEGPEVDAIAAKVEAMQERLEAAEAELAEMKKAEAERRKAEEEAAKKAADDVSRGKGPTGALDPSNAQNLGYNQWFSGNYMGTRVTFAFGDDNLLAGPRDRSPQAGFSLPNDQLFFEQITQAKRGYENETQLVVYKRMPTYFKNFDVEAALVIELQNWINSQTQKSETRIRDDGSYLKLNWYTKRKDYTGDHLNLTLFPVDSQRFLLGYTYKITWGGERIFPNNTGQVPGARLRYDWNVGTMRQSYAFVGAKTARLLNDEINEQQTYYGALGGFGVGITDWLMFEVNGGYFQRGAFPPQGVGYESIGGKTVKSFGGSSRLTFHFGEPVGSSIDFRLFRYQASSAMYLFTPQVYDDGQSGSIAGEVTAVGQELLQWEQPDQTVIKPAMAGTVLGKYRYKKLRFGANFLGRDLAYVVLDIPGIAPYRAFPEGAVVKPEWFVAGSVDYFFERPRITAGATLAFKQPASYTSNNVTTVIRDWDDWETLPAGSRAFNILASKLSFMWEIAPFFVIVSELRYTLDNNRTKYVKADNEAGRERVFEAKNVTNRLGFFILAQARW